MSDFLLIDLYAQRKEVLIHVQGWNTSDILQWMKQHGTVTEFIDSYGNKHYGFKSHVGDHTAFSLSDDEGLVVFQPR